jgi:hypothetical protein
MNVAVASAFRRKIFRLKPEATVVGRTTSIEDVVLCCFSDSDLGVYQRVLSE